MLLGGLISMTAAACAQPAPALQGEPGRDAPDGAAGDAALFDAAAPASWALYTLSVGDHFASLTRTQPSSPIDGFTSAAGRDYELALNPSAMYELTQPMQPDDQFDWNKLPGLSDCGTLDLAVNGAMFGWRYRLDTTPRVLELSAYANNNGKHLTPATPLATLDADDLTSDTPLRYRVWPDGSQYRFVVRGQVRGRMIDMTAALPRSCPAYAPTELKWAAGFYFGGTSTAPSEITARIREVPFLP